MSTISKASNVTEAPAGIEPAEGWCFALMGEIADVVGGGTPSSSEPDNFTDNGYPWITPADLSGFDDVYIQRGRRGLTERGLRSCSAALMPKGSVLMSSRAPIGYLAIAANQISTNQGFKSFILPPGISPEFCYYWLRFFRPELEHMGSGSTFSEISGSRAKEIPILLAPTNEQKQIVAKTDGLFKQVNATRARLARVPKILKRFRQSVLAAACSGRLTEDWRNVHPEIVPTRVLAQKLTEEARSGNGRGQKWLDVREIEGSEFPEIPDTWSWVNAGILYEDADYGTSVKCEKELINATPVLRVPNILAGKLDLTNLKYAKFTKSELSTLALKEGDVLICRTNGSLDLVGKTAVMPKLTLPHAFASYLIRIRSKSAALHPQYFHQFISAPVGRAQIEEKTRTTAGQFNLNLQILGGLALPLPPIEEQNESVRRVEALFKLADMIEKRVGGATKRAEKLTQAILVKAFQGKLVPTEAELARREGHSYEPASVLLERIKADRNRSSTDKSNGKRPRGKVTAGRG